MAEKKEKPEILFEDPHLIVLNKPAGMLSQGGTSPGENVVDWLRDYLGRHYVGLIHRLDRNVSGLMVVAKRSKSAARLTRALQEGRIHRTYLAWLTGKVSKDQVLKNWLRKDEKENRVSVVPAGRTGAREAVLHLHPLHTVEKKGQMMTLAEIRLESGRSHQIRVQCAHAGHAILGDPKYGKKTDFPGLNRPALHAARLEFPHPKTDEMQIWAAPLPSELEKLAHR